MLNFECLCSFHVYMHPCWLERLLCCERCFFSALRGLALLNSIFIGVSFGILIEGRKWRELLVKNVTQLNKQNVKKSFGSNFQVICLNKIKLYIIFYFFLLLFFILTKKKWFILLLSGDIQVRIRTPTSFSVRFDGAQARQHGPKDGTSVGTN